MANGKCAKCDEPVAHPSSAYCIKHRREYMREYQRGKGKTVQAGAAKRYNLNVRLDKKRDLARQGQLADAGAGFDYTFYYTVFYNDLRLREELSPIQYRNHHRSVVKKLKRPDCATWNISQDHMKIADLVASSAQAVTALAFWQALVCALCGRRIAECVDHCHISGLLRGLLCGSCNGREGRSEDSAFVYYRKVNPAAILGLRFPWAIYLEVPEPKVVGATVSLALE